MNVTARISLTLAAAMLLAGCAATRVAQVGPLTDGENLLTLLVSEDLSVVRRECANIPRVAGCFSSHTIHGTDGAPIKVLKIVRYADVLPPRAALERDADALCHAAAQLQNIPDPCGPGNPQALGSPLPAKPAAVTTR